MDEIELPTAEVRRWLADAARECGYPDEYADLLGYSAWWLENRGAQGVLRAAVYLLLIHGRSYDSLQPRETDDGLVSLCPISLGMLVTLQAEDNARPFADWIGGFRTADPLLMAPIIAQGLDYKYDVGLRYYDQDIRLSQNGMQLLSESLATFGMVDARSGVDTALRLTDAEAETDEFTFPYERRDFLKVPAKRYGSDGKFFFD